MSRNVEKQVVVLSGGRRVECFGDSPFIYFRMVPDAGETPAFGGAFILASPSFAAEIEAVRTTMKKQPVAVQG